MQYSDSFRSFFNAGKQNSGKTFDGFLKENGGYKSLLSAVDEKTARRAFERGAAITQKAQSQKKAPAKKVKKRSGSFVNNTTDSELNAVYEAVSKKLGIDIVKEQSLWTADDREANAQFIAKEMKVLISSDAQSEFTDTVHELGHLGEVRNKSAMQKVRQAILDWHNEVRGYNSTEEAISRFMQEYDCSRQDAIEEYTNEALAGLFSTDEGVKDFLSWLEEDSGYSKKEKKTVIQKIAELFDRLVESIRKIIAEGELSFAAKDFAQMQADRAAKIRKMFLDVLDGTSEQSARMSDEVKNSIKKTQNMSYDEQIEKIFSKRLNGSNSLYIGKPSEKLIKAGFSNAPFAMNQSDIRKSHEATAKNKNYSRHGVPKEFFEQLPSKINNAVMFIVNKNGTTVITDYQMNDRNGEKSFVVAGVWHNQKMENDTVNQIKSVYPLDDFKSQVYRASENRKLVITDKKKAQAMLTTIGVQPSEVSRLLELSNDSISQTGDDVKHFLNIDSEETKNSLKRTDSEGNELSEGQSKFFKNSKVRDEDGNLLVVYHGTDADFTAFDRTKGRSTMDIQGSFFSPWKLDASGYEPDVKAYYLNIENPASEGVAYKALNKFKGQNYAGVKAREYLESLGYDGVNNSDEEYIAFNPQQIKSIDNLSPTDNPDIRYSLKGISQDEVDKGKKKRHNKKRFYNEADTLFMQWSNSPSVPVGEREIFKRGKEWAFFKKTKDGCVELFRSKSKEVVREYERTYSEANNKIYGNSESIRSDQGRDIWNMRIPRNGGNDDGNVGQIGSKEFQADAEADEGHLLSGNRGISDVTDSEETKNSLRHSLGISDNTAEESLVAQNKAFRRIISEQQRVLNRHFVDAQKLKTLARVIKQDYRSTIDAAELTAMLGEAYTGMANGKTISPDVVSTQMRAIAEKVISASKNLTRHVHNEQERHNCYNRLSDE